jgi:hypothetical protein
MALALVVAVTVVRPDPVGQIEMGDIEAPELESMASN